MATVFLPNLMFEEQLSGEPIRQAAAQRARELAVVMGLLSDASPDTVLVTADGVPDGFPPCMQSVNFLSESRLELREWAGGRLIPWGYSEFARRTAERLDLHYLAPPIDVVRWINSRRFLVPWDQVISISDSIRVDEYSTEADKAATRSSATDGCSSGIVNAITARPFSTICRTLAEVVEELETIGGIFGSAWAIKADLSQAARSRLLGRGTVLSAPHRAWLLKQFAKGCMVAVEPWVSRLAECGLQFSILPASDGAHSAGSLNDAGNSAASRCDVKFDGLTRLVNTSSGGYLGSIVFGSERTEESRRIWHEAVRHGRRIAETVAEAGYYGWLGIDCMIFQLPAGQRFLRLANDINGRCTMGRVALHLSKWLKPEETGFWGHFSSDLLCARTFSFAKTLPDSVRSVLTSPRLMNGRPLNVSTGFFATTDSEAMAATIQHLSKQKS